MRFLRCLPDWSWSLGVCSARTDFC